MIFKYKVIIEHLGGKVDFTFDNKSCALTFAEQAKEYGDAVLSVSVEVRGV